VTEAYTDSLGREVDVTFDTDAPEPIATVLVGGAGAEVMSVEDEDVVVTATVIDDYVVTVPVFGGGPQGPSGPPGPAGGTYIHYQGIPSETWTIAHVLGFFPAVTVIDTSGAECIGETAYLDDDTIVLTFSAAFGGTAYLS
jgi:hypothetical protein